MITLDVHRDAIHYSDGTKCKPTAEINGKKAAQVMIITGCEGGGVEEFPRWYENLAFSETLMVQYLQFDYVERRKKLRYIDLQFGFW